MATRIRAMRGIDALSAAALEAAGVCTAGDAAAFRPAGGGDAKLWGAVTAVCAPGGGGGLVADLGTEEFKRALFSRCKSILSWLRGGADRVVPREFMCPLSLTWFQDPVITPRGHSYSRQWILDYLDMEATDPLAPPGAAQERLEAKDLVDNRVLQAATEFFREHGAGGAGGQAGR